MAGDTEAQVNGLGQDAFAEQPPEEEVPGGWDSKEQRLKMLQRLQPECEYLSDEQILDRQTALIELRELAMDPHNQEALWRDDEQLRGALQYCIEPPSETYGGDGGKSFFQEEIVPTDDMTKTIAMSVIAVLASSRANRHAMNADKTTRTHLTFSTDAEQPNIDKERESDVKERPQPIRTRAYMGISHLALDGGLQGAGENQVELLPERVGPCPVCELEDCVCDAGVDVDRSNPTDHLEGLAVGLGPDQPDIARIQICGSLWTLAAQYSADARSLWTNSKFRQALVNAALVEQPLAVRTAALGALWSFALVEETKELMWKDAPLRQAVISGAGPDMPVDTADESLGRLLQPPEMRLKALGALLVLSEVQLNREAIWGDGRVAGMLLRTAGAANRIRRIRAAALDVLTELSKCDVNTGPMVSVGADAILGQAAGEQEFSAVERRRFGFGHTRLVDGTSGGPRVPKLY